MSPISFASRRTKEIEDICAEATPHGHYVSMRQVIFPARSLPCFLFSTVPEWKERLLVVKVLVFVVVVAFSFRSSLFFKFVFPSFGFPSISEPGTGYAVNKYLVMM